MVCEVFNGNLVYVVHLLFNATLGDVEVFELCHWVLMNGSSSSRCDGYKGVG